MSNPPLTIGDQAIAKCRPHVEMSRKHTFSEYHQRVSKSRKISILWPEIQIADDRKRDVDDHEEHQEMHNMDESRWTGKKPQIQEGKGADNVERETRRELGGQSRKTCQRLVDNLQARLKLVVFEKAEDSEENRPEIPPASSRRVKETTNGNTTTRDETRTSARVGVSCVLPELLRSHVRHLLEDHVIVWCRDVYRIAHSPLDDGNPQCDESWCVSEPESEKRHSFSSGGFTQTFFE